MSNSGRREAPFLFIGDIGFLILALWATLFVRYGSVPTGATFVQHLVPFSFLFLLSALVFFIAGLYDKHTLLFKSRLPETIFYAQIANILSAALFFFLIPAFGIQPKTNLFIYLLLSTTLISLWRVYLFPLFSARTREPALLVCSGADCTTMYDEINGNNRYGIRFEGEGPVADPDTAAISREIRAHVQQKKVSVVVLPFSLFDDPAFLPEWGRMVFQGVRFIDAALLYEDVFDKVSLSLLSRQWFLDESAKKERGLYVFFKRAMDIVIAATALIALSPFILLAALIVKIGEGGGSAFIFQTRIGKGGHEIKIVKFRTMLFDDGGDPIRQAANTMTVFGRFLRTTQLDEVPQFWNVIRGDLSLIGPRPEVPLLTLEYEKAVPFYNTRHMIEPGISGWAQIKHASPPKFKLDVDATHHKLSYDLYYLKHRSLTLDIAIILQTVKILLSRAGK